MAYLNESELKKFELVIATQDGCCASCRFWKMHEPPNWDGPSKDLKDVFPEAGTHLRFRGYCKRHAPVLDLEEMLASWPEVNWDDWCGDYDSVPTHFNVFQEPSCNYNPIKS